MKKLATTIILCLLAIVCAIGFTACGGDDKNKGSTPSDGKEEYTINFDLDGGTTNSKIESKKVSELKTEDFIFDVVKEGYNFRGWEYEETVVFNESGEKLNNVTLVDGMTFKALFIKKQYTVHFDLDGGITYSVVDDKKEAVFKIDDIKVTELKAEDFTFDVTKEGFDFRGWEYNGKLVFDEEGNKVNQVSLFDGITFKAIFREKQYLIRFDLGGGTSQSFVKEKNVKQLAAEDFFFDVIKEGVNFRGWDYKGTLIFDENGKKINDVKMVDGMTFTARYNNKAKLTIVSNMPEAGTFEGGKECDFCTFCDISAKPNEGYNFLGWYQINSQTLDYDVLISTEQDYKFKMWTGDVTIQAKFEVASFALHIFTNNPDLGQVYDSLSSIKFEQNEYNLYHKYLSQTTISAKTKTDEYRFLGWYDEENNLVSPNAVYSFNMVNYDYSLEAKWNRFNIEYDLNGGKQNPLNPETYSFEDTKQLYNPTSIPIGYSSFKGWESEEKIITEIKGEMTKHLFLKATWNKNEYTLLINYYLNGTSKEMAPAYQAQIEYDTEYSIYSPVIKGYIPNYETVSGVMQGTRGITVNVYYSPIFTISGDTVTGLTSAGQQLTEIEIPEILYGESISKIGDSAFRECRLLENITIGTNITSIGRYAFYNCSSLKRINSETDGVFNIKNSVKSLGDYAFGYCTLLTKAVIDSGVEKIGSAAFTGCINLQEITLPFIGANSGVTSSSTYQYPLGYIFGTSSCSGCTATKQIYYGSSTISTTSNTYYIPTSLRKVTVYGGYIPYGAFYNCSNLLNIELGGNVTAIGDYAMYFCTSLIKVTIENNVKSIGDYAFNYCYNLSNLNMPSYIEHVGNYVFEYCYKLQFNEYGNLKYLGNSTNDYLVLVKAKDNDISTCTISSSCKIIVSLAFLECNNLTSLSVENGNSKYQSSNNCVIEKSTKTLILGCNRSTIPSDSSVTNIGSYAFSNCNKLTKVEIPKNITMIGEGAFSGCSSLKELTIPFVGAKAGVTSSSIYQYPLGYIFGTSSYSGSTAVTQSYYGSSTGSTTSNTYYIPGSLTNVKVSGGYIPYGAFYNCSMLQEVVLGESVTSIGNMAFYYCSSLLKLVMNYGLTSIGNYAFEGCSNLTSITIPSSVIKIGSYAFYNCSNLTSIIFENTSNWYRTTNSGYYGGTYTSVTNSYTNATNFKSNYYNYYWYVD